MPQPNRTRLYNVLTVIFVNLTIVSATLMAWVGAHPNSILNPFPIPPTPTLASTITPIPSATPSPSPTNTFTITPTVTAAPTSTMTPPPTPTFTPPATAPPDWAEVIILREGYALQLPSTWVVFDLTERDPAAMLAQMTLENPELSTSVLNGLGPTKPDTLSLLAFDAASVDAPYIVNLNVSAPAPADGQAVEGVVSARQMLYESDPSYTLLASAPISVDSQPAAQILYTSGFEIEVEREGEEGEPTIEEETLTIYHQDIIIQRPDGILLTFTFSTDMAHQEAYEAIINRVVASIRFLR